MPGLKWARQELEICGNKLDEKSMDPEAYGARFGTSATKMVSYRDLYNGGLYNGVLMICVINGDIMV